jgi:hypothetical protein
LEKFFTGTDGKPFDMDEKYFAPIANGILVKIFREFPCNFVFSVLKSPKIGNLHQIVGLNISIVGLNIPIVGLNISNCWAKHSDCWTKHSDCWTKHFDCWAKHFQLLG